MKSKLLRRVVVGALAIMFLSQAAPVQAMGEVEVYGVKPCPPHNPTAISSTLKEKYTVVGSHYYGTKWITDPNTGTRYEVNIYCKTETAYARYEVIYSCYSCNTYTYIESESRQLGYPHHSECKN